MKELKRLERHVEWCECIHLALLTLCLAVPISLIFTEDAQSYRLLWAFGTVVPVQLVRLICTRVDRKPLRFLLCMLLTLAALAVTRRNYHWVYYLAALVPILISGLILPRNRGKLILTVPSVFTLFVPLPAYVIGRAIDIPLIAVLAVVFSALLTLVYLLHLNLIQLLREIRISRSAELSLSGMVRQNRRVMAVFCLIGAVVIAAVPFFVREEPSGEPIQMVEYEETAAQTEETEAEVRKDYIRSKEGNEFRLGFIQKAFYWTVGISSALALLVIFVVGIRTLLGFVKRKRTPPDPELFEDLTISKLGEKPFSHGRERITGYEKKIRRRYEKLIRSRVPGAVPLAALTPTELEQAAGLNGPGAETVHELYRLTRYSQQPATRETYSAFKDAVRSLDPVLPQREQTQAGK